MYLPPSNIARRQFLQASGAGLGALALVASQNQGSAEAGPVLHLAPNATSVIFFSMPDGTWTSKAFPQVSRHRDDLCIVPSLSTEWNRQILAVGTAIRTPGNGGLPNYVTLLDAEPPARRTPGRHSMLPTAHEALRLRDVGLPAFELPPSKSVTGDADIAHQMQAAALEAGDIECETPSSTNLYGLHDDDRRMASFGRKCLLARRLIERGVNCVHVHDGDPSHRARRTDQPIAALISDLKQRGLLNSTLLVWSGNAGSQLSDSGFCGWVAGGGIQSGASYA